MAILPGRLSCVLESVLMSLGFEDHTKAAKKAETMLSLLEAHLMPQQHYQFGPRMLAKLVPYLRDRGPVYQVRIVVVKWFVIGIDVADCCFAWCLCCATWTTLSCSHCATRSPYHRTQHLPHHHPDSNTYPSPHPTPPHLPHLPHLTRRSPACVRHTSCTTRPWTPCSPY